ncbi:helix-turn-helix domain-containing protein [Paenibacillus larvae]|nr:helix-turn-helix domain-containing protein [Paenibacillus larvae]MDT2275915.1 helix-turn-helix domain-containing protein [Paenibacillus larvae]
MWFRYKRVAKELNIPEASIRRWVKYYENEGMAGARRETWEIKRFGTKAGRERTL